MEFLWHLNPTTGSGQGQDRARTGPGQGLHSCFPLPSSITCPTQPSRSPQALRTHPPEPFAMEVYGPAPGLEVDILVQGSDENGVGVRVGEVITISFTLRQLRMPIVRLLPFIRDEAGILGEGSVDIAPLFGDDRQVHNLHQSLGRVIHNLHQSPGALGGRNRPASLRPGFCLMFRPPQTVWSHT